MAYVIPDFHVWLQMAQKIPSQFVRLDLAEDFALFQIPIIANTDFCHTHFAPAGLDAAGHMLKVIVIEKDTLQVVDDHVDGSVGSIPNLAVIGSPGCNDPDVNMGLFKARDTDFCLLGDGLVDHPDPVFFQGTGQFLQPRKWLRYHQADHLIGISLGDRHFPDDPLGCRTKIYHIVHHTQDMTAKPQRLLVRLFQHLEGKSFYPWADSPQPSPEPCADR